MTVDNEKEMTAKKSCKVNMNHLSICSSCYVVDIVKWYAVQEERRPDTPLPPPPPLSLYLYVPIFICLSVYLSVIYLSASVSVCLSVSLCLSLSVSLSLSLYIYMTRKEIPSMQIFSFFSFSFLYFFLGWWWWRWCLDFVCIVLFWLTVCFQFMSMLCHEPRVQVDNFGTKQWLCWAPPFLIMVLTHSIPSCSKCLHVMRQYLSNKTTKQEDVHSNFGSLTKKVWIEMAMTKISTLFLTFESCH